MSYSFTKFMQNGSEYYFAASWKEKFGDVELNLFHDGSCYNCSVNVKDFESFSSHVKLGLNEFWEQSLSMWTNNSLERKDLEVKHDDQFNITFVWKKVLPSNPIKQRMGSMKLKKNVGKGNNFFDFLVNVLDQQKQTLEKLNLEQKILLKSHNDSLKKLQELSNIKEDIERKLFSKFVQVLNKKKDKIKYLKAELETREFDPTHPKDNATSRKRKQIMNLTTRKKNVSSESGDDYCNSISSKTSGDEKSATDDKESNAGSVSTTDDIDFPDNHCLEEIVTLDVQANNSEVCSDMESDTSDQLIIKQESSLSTSIKIEQDEDHDETQEFMEENLATSIKNEQNEDHDETQEFMEEDVKYSQKSEYLDNLEESQAKTEPLADKFDSSPSNDDVGSNQEILNSRSELHWRFGIMEKTLSQKQKDHLLYDGYRLRRDKSLSDGSTAWRCTRKMCSGRIKVSKTGYVVVVTEHNHASDPDRNEASKVVAEIRRLAVTTAEKPRLIIQQTASAVSLEVASRLPDYTTSQRMIQRQRKRCAVPYGPY